MPHKLRFHPKVSDDLRVIAEIVSSHSGTSEATHKLIQIQETAYGLVDNPEKGSAHYKAGSALRVASAGRKGVVVFEVDKETKTVFILAISYGGTDWISQIADRKAI